ncbi:MAG: N-acetylmuramoyl-L-alanine amidase [Proteobacteria bacterium]|nr:N-acetylmuramoyl-L-alanine amidase [Pseudomonadota bacterium]
MTGRTLAIFVVLAALLGGALPAGQAQAESAVPSLPSVTAVRVGGDGQKTRFIMDLSQKFDFAAFALADPYRVVLDLPQVAFHLPDKAGEQARGLVKAFRYGLIMQGGSRVVLDTTGPVKVEKAFVLEATADQPARLVVDLATTDRSSFMRALTLDNGPERRMSAKLPDVPPKAADDPRPLIVLDPGHGGIDQGARAASGELEKDVVLQFATTLRARLEASGKYRVAMTRSDDTFIPLSERVRFGRSHGASLFISIHCDSLPKSEGQAEGATVYTLSENASDAEAARLAEAENKADVIAGVDLTAEPDDVANILVDLAQRETKTYSAQFARSVVGELKSTARLHKHPLKSAGFKVLTAPDVPSVLVELGYMSTKEDLKLLTNTGWQAKTAAAVGQAVDQFFAPRLARGSARAN